MGRLLSSQSASQLYALPILMPLTRNRSLFANQPVSQSWAL